MIDLSREIVRLPLSDPGSSPIHIGVACPNSYPVALASLGFQIVHLIAATHPGIVAHRIVMEDADRPYSGRTLEERLEIRSLAAVFFSCSFELDYIHLVRVLNAAGIPVLRRERGSPPLIIVGGIAPTANPEPLALVADAIAIGAAELTLPGILDDLLDAHPLLSGPGFEMGREGLYEAWDQRDGIYVPALWEDGPGDFNDRGRRRVTQVEPDKVDDYPSYTPIVSPDGTYGPKNLVEISSGCPARCRFCLYSFVIPTVEPRSLRNVLENARIFSPEEATIGLVSSRVSDHPDIVEMVDSLADDGYEVSVSSMRISSTTPKMLASLARAGSKTVTFAPEHGSERLREMLCKPYTPDEVKDRVSWAYDAGLSRVKLYFMTGFEEETDEDLDQTSLFVLTLAESAGLTSRPPESRMNVSLAPFVPKPGTPFQRRPMQDEKTLRRKMDRITRALKGYARLEVETESPRLAVIQGVLSQADRAISEHLKWISTTRENLGRSWEAALRVCGDWPKTKLIEGRSSEDRLPWDFVRRRVTGEGE